jgi:hypothetical protein
MLKRIFIEFLFLTVGAAILKWLFRIAFGLSSNAVMGWGDDQIAQALDIKAPALLAVISAVVEWGPPFIAMGVLLAIYHLYHLLQRKPRAAPPHSLPPGKIVHEPPTAASRRLQGLSGLQLREAAIALAAQMRIFQANTNLYSMQRSLEHADPHENFRKGAQHHTAVELEFKNKYLGNARDLRDEIKFRLDGVGILQPYVDLSIKEQLGAYVLDNGRVVGANPISNAGDYLEKLARRLPIA